MASTESRPATRPVKRARRHGLEQLPGELVAARGQSVGDPAAHAVRLTSVARRSVGCGPRLTKPGLDQRVDEPGHVAGADPQRVGELALGARAVLVQQPDGADP